MRKNEEKKFKVNIQKIKVLVVSKTNAPRIRDKKKKNRISGKIDIVKIYF